MFLQILQGAAFILGGAIILCFVVILIAMCAHSHGISGISGTSEDVDDYQVWREANEMATADELYALPVTEVKGDDAELFFGKKAKADPETELAQARHDAARGIFPYSRPNNDEIAERLEALDFKRYLDRLQADPRARDLFVVMLEDFRKETGYDEWHK